MKNFAVFLAATSVAYIAFLVTVDGPGRRDPAPHGSATWPAPAEVSAAPPATRPAPATIAQAGPRLDEAVDEPAPEVAYAAPLVQTVPNAVLNQNPPPPADKAAPLLSIENYFVEVGEVAAVVPQTNCLTVKYFAIDRGLTILPQKYANTETDFVAWCMTPGQYRIAGYASLNDQLSDPVTFLITVTNHAPQPPPQPGPEPGPQPPQPQPPQPVPPQPQPPTPQPQPPTPQPQPPAIETASQLWLVTVDDVLRRQPATATIMADPIWQTLQKQGHQFRHYNVTDEAAKNYTVMLDANGGQPVIVIMSVANNHWLNKDPIDLKLPATAAGVQTLVDKYTGKK